MPAPIVHLGPSLSRREAESLLPGADFRPPVRRGDLYRAREQGGEVFLVIDGVFMQEHAISPREVVDVLRDGARIIGASSMGALRAAECWPAGMHGVGAIYRLFRRGRLTSDDEVAVMFDPEGERPASLALVNVRHAVARALRQGHLTRPEAERLVRVAEETFYAERSWRTLVKKAGLADASRLEERLSGWDLKADDARRALRYLARQLASPPHRARGSHAKPAKYERPEEPPRKPSNARGSRPGRTKPGRLTAQPPRERSPDALAGLKPTDVRRALARWHLVSGRYTRHALAIAAASPELSLPERLRENELAALVLSAPLRDRTVRSRTARLAASKREQEGVRSLLALRLALAELWALFTAHEALFADRLWQQLHLSHELDAEVFRWRAIHEAASRARASGLVASPRDWHFAREEVAHAHGFDTWGELEHAARARPGWPSFLAYVETRALSRRMREAL
ncbi:hypothetical protein HPC49_28255 [Pyxidicoccus fallax]|uniref:TfuA-like core domain-containing protein n=1 Tax=Pyxidicoccus fallax TaxID=394095 RepID=A0A848LSP7_9BACT|nr:TfuA-like protein [Pyxidicoccus fallax]NMO20533.1 hypothetical protein [Pyxidicoccus fallax]NPC82098.1 hypothetical protein [Pyxidicoccus fallax]